LAKLLGRSKEDVRFVATLIDPNIPDAANESESNTTSLSTITAQQINKTAGTVVGHDTVSRSAHSETAAMSEISLTKGI